MWPEDDFEISDGEIIPITAVYEIADREIIPVMALYTGAVVDDCIQQRPASVEGTRD